MKKKWIIAEKSSGLDRKLYVLSCIGFLMWYLNVRRKWEGDNEME